MKRIFKNILLSGLVTVMMIIILPGTVYAGEVVKQKSFIQSNEILATRAEQKGYKYKILNGKQWKRRWSYTYNKWIDSEWTLA